jgi:hypothetical protein
LSSLSNSVLSFTDFALFTSFQIELFVTFSFMMSNIASEDIYHQMADSTALHASKPQASTNAHDMLAQTAQAHNAIHAQRRAYLCLFQVFLKSHNLFNNHHLFSSSPIILSRKEFMISIFSSWASPDRFLSLDCSIYF